MRPTCVTLSELQMSAWVHEWIKPNALNKYFQFSLQLLLLIRPMHSVQKNWKLTRRILCFFGVSKNILSLGQLRSLHAMGSLSTYRRTHFPFAVRHIYWRFAKESNSKSWAGFIALASILSPWLELRFNACVRHWTALRKILLYLSKWYWKILL